MQVTPKLPEAAVTTVAAPKAAAKSEAAATQITATPVEHRAHAAALLAK